MSRSGSITLRRPLDSTFGLPRDPRGGLSPCCIFRCYRAHFVVEIRPKSIQMLKIPPAAVGDSTVAGSAATIRLSGPACAHNQFIVDS